MINFIYMLNNFICETFEYLVGTWQGPIGSDGQPTERKALLICFRINGKNKVKILLHAPANYVGVYKKVGNKPWTCLGYHDSCWRDSLERFLFEHKDDIRFEFNPPKDLNIITSVSRAVLIISLTEEELKTLNEVRNKKYN